MKVKPFSAEKIRIPTDFAEFGKQSEEVVNLACCENSCASEAVLGALRNPKPELVTDHWNAQDPILRNKLAELHGVKPEQIYITSGALAGIRHCFDLFVDSNTNVGLLRPDFSGFIHYAERKKSNVHWLNKTEFPFVAKPSEITDFVEKQNIGFLITSNPSAVTGTLKIPREIEELVKSTPETLYIVDEADAIDTDSSGYLTNTNRNLIVLRSFSKFYGLSGLRVGYLVCPQELSEHFDRTIDPIELTAPAILAATKVLDDKEYQIATQERVRRNLSCLENACEGTPYKVVPGSKCFASYLWADESVEDPYVTLRKHGVKLAKGETFGLSRGGRANLSGSERIDALVEVINSLKE